MKNNCELKYGKIIFNTYFNQYTKDVPGFYSPKIPTMVRQFTYKGNDVWTYNWTVADSDTPCGDLVFGTPTLPSWLTFTNNGDCTGTLTGTMPSGGGSFPVVLNVTDGTNSDSQTFTIAGLTITPNSSKVLKN